MTGVFSRLNVTNIDQSKMTSGLTLTANSLNLLSSLPQMLTSDQKNKLSNTSSGTTFQNQEFYVNPVANACISLTANVNSIITLVNTTITTANFTSAPAEAATFLTAAENFLIEIASFKSHTDNISGVAAQSQNSEPLLAININAANIPDYEKCITVGNEVLRLVYQTDNVQNTLPILGNFTSLFINDELTANSVNVAKVLTSINASWDGATSSNMNAATLLTHTNTINSVNTFIVTRRTSDYDFYNEELRILNDVIKIKQVSTVGNSEKFLINNYIGTTTLKTLIQ
jgi:hypothetical protein